MRPRRPTAWEVSFPEEPDLGQFVQIRSQKRELDASIADTPVRPSVLAVAGYGSLFFLFSRRQNVH